MGFFLRKFFCSFAAAVILGTIWVYFYFIKKFLIKYKHTKIIVPAARLNIIYRNEYRAYLMVYNLRISLILERISNPNHDTQMRIVYEIHPGNYFLIS